MSVTLARGGGITSGGIVRDVGLSLSGSSNVAYGLVFGGAALGMIVALWCLSQVHVEQYEDILETPPNPEIVLSASLD
jgi:hypothetical protein